MVLIEVQIETYLGKDDIIRYEDIYARNLGKDYKKSVLIMRISGWDALNIVT